MNFTEMTLLGVQLDLYFSSRPAKKVMQIADGMYDKKFGIKVPISGRKARSDACPLPRRYRNPKSVAGMF